MLLCAPGWYGMWARILNDEHSVNDRKSHAVRANLFLFSSSSHHHLRTFDLFFCSPFPLGLQRNCLTYKVWDEENRELYPLADMPGVQPENYLVRFPFYILAERDATIIFSETKNPDWLVDNAYEIGEKFGDTFAIGLDKKKSTAWTDCIEPKPVVIWFLINWF